MSGCSPRNINNLIQSFCLRNISVWSPTQCFAKLQTIVVTIDDRRNFILLPFTESQNTVYSCVGYVRMHAILLAWRLVAERVNFPPNTIVSVMQELEGPFLRSSSRSSFQLLHSPHALPENFLLFKSAGSPDMNTNTFRFVEGWIY